MSLVRKIPVTDANGDELILYEIEDRRAFWRERRFMLCTGEAVEAVGDDEFVIAATGEKLSRIK